MKFILVLIKIGPQAYGYVRNVMALKFAITTTYSELINKQDKKETNSVSSYKIEIKKLSPTCKHNVIYL